MKHSFLLPHRAKLPVMIALALFTALFIANGALDSEFSWLHQSISLRGLNTTNDNFTDELALSGVIVSALALSLCAERREDEYINTLRLSSWKAAILTNFSLLIASIWLTYGLSFLGILYYNTLTPLIIYLLVFYSRLYVLPRLRRNAAL